MKIQNFRVKNCNYLIRFLKGNLIWKPFKMPLPKGGKKLTTIYDNLQQIDKKSTTISKL